MDMNAFYGILIPFIGTSAGAACVFFMKKDLNAYVQRCLTGFAAGVMVAASIWSLLIPAIDQSVKSALQNGTKMSVDSPTEIRSLSFNWVVLSTTLSFT